MEQHLLSCEGCRDQVATAAGRAVADLDAVWERTRDAVELPRPSMFERLLRAPVCRRPMPGWSRRPAPSVARGWPAWPRCSRSPLSRRRSGMPAGLVLPGRGAARAVPGGRVQLRPAVGPGARTRDGHALSGAAADLAAHVAVLALALPAVLLLGLVVPGDAPFAWLLPAAGFVAVVLAASTWVSPLNAAMAVSAAWLMTVWLVATRLASPGAVLQARIQVAFLVLARHRSELFWCAGATCANFGRGGSGDDCLDQLA